MKTVLVTGSNGLLGQKLTDLYVAEHAGRVNLVCTGKGADRYPNKGGYVYGEMDITDKESVKNAFAIYKPDCVIHTAAMTNVDECENNKAGCDLLNITAPEYLLEEATAYKAQFIHLSTDFIFDGEAGPYKEEDKPNPISYYGLSKLKGEELVKKYPYKWSILRTVLVYGIVSDMSRSNIVLWAKGALESGKNINVVDDQFRSPTLAEDLAQGCMLAEKQEATGIYNISGKDFMSVLELVERVADFWKLDKSLINVISSTTLSQPAKRPPITGFNLDKSIRELNYQPHSFEEGLELLDRQLREAKH